MHLRDAFLAALPTPPPHAPSEADAEALEGALEAALERARDGTPGVTLDPSKFVAYVAARIDPDAKALDALGARSASITSTSRAPASRATAPRSPCSSARTSGR